MSKKCPLKSDPVLLKVSKISFAFILSTSLCKYDDFRFKEFSDRIVVLQSCDLLDLRFTLSCTSCLNSHLIFNIIMYSFYLLILIALQSSESVDFTPEMFGGFSCGTGEIRARRTVDYSAAGIE